MKIFSLLLVLSLLQLTKVWGQAGNLDFSFGDYGRVVKDINSGSDDFAYYVAMEPDGKIIITGGTGKLDTGSIAIVRLNDNGSPDPTFGNDGVVITNLWYGAFWPFDVALKNDGNILVLCLADLDPGININWEFCLIQYLPNGNLDSAFGANGIHISPIGIYNSMILQPDGKILLAGTSEDQWNQMRFTVARLNADGTFDNSFGNNGVAKRPITGQATAIALLDNGEIVALGKNSQQVIVEYKSDGIVDSSFGDNGIVEINGQMEDDGALAIDGDEKILVANGIWNGSAPDFFLARFNQDGSTDSSFGISGMVQTTIGIEAIASSVLVQSDGKIVVAGTAQSVGLRDFELVRYKSNGEIDSSFGTSGMVHTNIGTDDHLNAATLQSNGEIVAVGWGTSSQGGWDFGIVRYLNDQNVGLSNESNAPANFSIFPNPSSGITNVAISTVKQGDEISISVSNSLGQKLFISKEQVSLTPFETEIDLENLAAGLYLVNLQSKDFSLQKKLVISR